MTMAQNLEFNKNEDKMMQLVGALQRKLDKVYEGGGKSRIAKEHEKGKLTARERIDYLLDDDAPRVEIGALAADDMYREHGGCPSAGVVVMIGYVRKKQCIVVANDATVKAGAWFPMTGKKNLRAQEIAMENRIPIIYLVDSAGVYLPMQDEIFPDKEHFGRIFRNNAIMSSRGIPQIAAIMGSCVAGGAYLPIMSDEAMIVDKTGTIFLAGSYLVKAAIGEDIDNETLGGATTHCEISGVTDYKAKDDKDALNRIKNIMDKMGRVSQTAGFDKISSVPTRFPAKELYGILPEDRVKPYNVIDIIERIIDSDTFEEYKPDYGKSIVCGTARIDGWAVGIVANQRLMVKSKKEGMAVNENNTHPFTYEGITFIHNGSITPPTALDSVIDKKYLELVKGNTDSERYFLYLLTQIDKHGFIEGVKQALSYIKANCSFSSINMMIINETTFMAACIYNQDKIPQKFINDTDYYHLKYTKRDGQVVVASSGWNQDGWQEIPNGSVLVVDRGGGKEKLEVLS